MGRNAVLHSDKIDSSKQERIRVMAGQDAIINLIGDMTVTDIVIWIAAAGYIVSHAKSLYGWMRQVIHKGDETGEAIDNARNLGKYHQQSIEIRDGLRKDINMIKETVENITHRLDAMEERSRKKEKSRSSSHASSVAICWVSES